MINKVMVLGAGRGQIPIMNLCHDYGWYVIAVSSAGNYPGVKVADKVYWINVRDKDAVLQAAKEENIKAIITDQLDVGIQTAAYVAEQMRLPGITCPVALKFTNKSIMRQEAQNAGINVPEWISVTHVDNVFTSLDKKPELKFPLIMKPVDSDGSRGVFKVNSIEDIVKQFEISKQYSKSGEVILEQFIGGTEYVVEAFTRDFETVNLIVGSRDYFQIPNIFIPNATVFHDAVSANSEVEERIKQTNIAIITAFGLKFGITHGEYIYNEEEDKVYLVEIAARGGGVFISSDLIPEASGVKADDLLIKEALGIGEREPITIHPGAAAYFCYLTPSGTVTELKGVSEASRVEGVIKAYIDNITVGMETEPITDKSSRKGPILVKGTTQKDCYDIIERVKKQLIIKVTSGTEIQDVIWH